MANGPNDKVLEQDNFKLNGHFALVVNQSKPPILQANDNRGATTKSDHPEIGDNPVRQGNARDVVWRRCERNKPQHSSIEAWHCQVQLTISIEIRSGTHAQSA